MAWLLVILMGGVVVLCALVFAASLPGAEIEAMIGAAVVGVVAGFIGFVAYGAATEPDACYGRDADDQCSIDEWREYLDRAGLS